MTNTPTTVTINLNSSDYNSNVPVDELVHRSCYEDLKKKIDNDLQKAHNPREGCKDDSALFDKYPSGSGLVYFIDGTRGAGKSTFLCSAFKGLSDIGKGGPTLAPLAYIDPSRLENNEIILLSILKALKEAVDKHKPRRRNEESYKDFRESFKKLAGGLSLFAKDHHPLQHLDPELFLDHGLTRAGYSKDLRRHLHEVFDYACNLLGAKALLLAFDDADTNSAHALKVLECIRNYLDTPRIVTLVTGDLELYSLLVRDHFFNNLDHSRYDKDDERHQQRTRMEDHLEDQYLLKLFPIQRRYRLRPLGSLLKDSTIAYTLAHDDRFDERTPQEALDELIRRGLRIKNNADIVFYREFLLQQPLRSVLQLLSRCAPHLCKQAEKDKEKEWNEKLSEALRESLRGMALGSLYTFGVDVDALANKDLPALIDAVFDLALRDGDSDTAAYLRPQTKDDGLKCCFTALAAEVAWQCAANPSAAIFYLLGGPGSVSLFGKELRRNEKKIDRDILCQQFRQYMGIGRREDALNWARHATAIIAATHRQSETLIEFGVIGLNKSKPDNSTTGENKKNFPNFDSFSNFFKNKTELPVFALSLVDLSGSSSGTTYASIHNILGLIERVLVSDDVSEVLKKPYPALSISRPEWGYGWSSSIDDDDGHTESEEKEKMPMLSDNVTNEIQVWADTFKVEVGKLTPSAVMLGKIWTRLYFSLEKASDTLRPLTKPGAKMIGAASIMEIFALCVINAFLVEEVEHHLATDGTNASPLNDRTNPQISAKNFINNKIAFLAEHKDSLPFSYAIATCPLIVGLIKQESYAVDNFSTLLFGNKNPTNQEEEKVKNLLCSKEHWGLINSSFIAGRCKKSGDGLQRKQEQKSTSKKSGDGLQRKQEQRSTSNNSNDSTEETAQAEAAQSNNGSS
jgi:hypothetical protein